MKISARNVLKGKVVNLRKGAVNTEVTLELNGGDQIVAMISSASVAHLKLRKGKKAWAVIKASNVMVAID